MAEPAAESRGRRVGTAVATGCLGAGAATGALIVLGLTGVGDFLMVEVGIFAPWLLLAAVAGSGVVVGLAALSARTRSGAWRRAEIAMVVLAVVGVTAVATRGGPLTDFDAGDWRAAAARGDLDAMETQGRRAEEEGVLLGLDRAQVRRTLGEPERRRRRDTVWTWELGMVNDGLGPGDGGGFRVVFDRETGTVRSAAVEAFGG